MDASVKWLTFPTRAERNSERIYRIKEEIHDCNQVIKQATLAEDHKIIRINLRRIELLNQSLNESW